MLRTIDVSVHASTRPSAKGLEEYGGDKVERQGRLGRRKGGKGRKSLVRLETSPFHPLLVLPKIV